MTRAIYPSDITREQFEIIRPMLAKKRTHPPTYDLYDIFCAVLYLLKEGCT
ncbi:MAG: IS5/IS1182 family transposase, partial [Bacillus sp. (in: firmicutes)]